MPHRIKSPHAMQRSECDLIDKKYLVSTKYFGTYHIRADTPLNAHAGRICFTLYLYSYDVYAMNRLLCPFITNDAASIKILCVRPIYLTPYRSVTQPAKALDHKMKTVQLDHETSTTENV